MQKLKTAACLFALSFLMFACKQSDKPANTTTEKPNTSSTPAASSSSPSTSTSPEKPKEEKGQRGATRGKFRDVSSVEINGEYIASFDAEEIPNIMPASNYGVSLTKEQIALVKTGDKVSCELLVGSYPDPNLMFNIKVLPADTELKLAVPSKFGK